MADRVAVSVETAHPAKFPRRFAPTRHRPAVPPSLAGLEDLPEHFETMGVAYEPFRDLLRARFGAQ
jgi:threonine synthase